MPSQKDICHTILVSMVFLSSPLRVLGCLMHMFILDVHYYPVGYRTNNKARYYFTLGDWITVFHASSGIQISVYVFYFRRLDNSVPRLIWHTEKCL